MHRRLTQPLKANSGTSIKRRIPRSKNFTFIAGPPLALAIRLLRRRGEELEAGPALCDIEENPENEDAAEDSSGERWKAEAASHSSWLKPEEELEVRRT